MTWSSWLAVAVPAAFVAYGAFVGSLLLLGRREDARALDQRDIGPELAEAAKRFVRS